MSKLPKAAGKIKLTLPDQDATNQPAVISSFSAGPAVGRDCITARDIKVLGNSAKPNYYFGY